MHPGTESVYIIAEVGSNHDASLDRALAFIDACADAGVDAVKFQSWRAQTLHNALEMREDGSWGPAAVLPLLKRLELPDEWHPVLAGRCRDRGVDFLSTPFDPERARFLRDLGVSAMKISSSDLTYDELVAEIGGFGLPVLLSTGMADPHEIAHALELLGPNRTDVTLLQCTAAYPPQIEDANLLAIPRMQAQFRKPVGISDHFASHDTVVAAVALGARVVEKHVTFSRKDPTPDAPFAIEMHELRALVEAVRRIELALGNGEKRCMDSERGGLRGGRRGLYAARPIRAGDRLTRDAVAVVRPGVTELQPGDLATLLGKRVVRDLDAGWPLNRRDFSD